MPYKGHVRRLQANKATISEQFLVDLLLDWITSEILFITNNVMSTNEEIELRRSLRREYIPLWKY